MHAREDIHHRGHAQPGCGDINLLEKHDEVVQSHGRVVFGGAISLEALPQLGVVTLPNVLHALGTDRRPEFHMVQSLTVLVNVQEKGLERL